MKKKLLALLLVVVMLISIVPVTAFADELEARGSHGHHWPQWPQWPEHKCTWVEVDRDEATCEEDGAIYYACESKWCDKTHKEVLTAPGHSEVEIPAVDPTCTVPGKEAGIRCENCDYVVEGDEIPAPGHSMVTDEAKDPTCTVPGLTEGSHCKNCDHKIAQEVVKPNGHNFKVDKKTIKEATCTEKGVVECKSLCACGEQWGWPWYEFTDENGHDMVTDAAVKPTCTTPGLTEGSHCKNCDLKVAQKFIPATGHKYEIVKVTINEPTCTAEGLAVAKWQCSVCKHQRGFVFGWDWWYEPIAKVPHTEVVDAAVPATCTETGLTEGSHCDVCGEVLVAQEVVPTLEHIKKETLEIAPACGVKGLNVVTCEREGCDLKKEFEVPALEHIKKETLEIAPACGVKGLNVVTCEREGCELKKKFDVPALGHKEVDVAAVAPTCTKTGLTAGKKCSVCGEFTVAQKEVAALGHTAKVVPAVAATCEATGLTEGKVCSVCGEVLVKQAVTAAIGHAWDEGKITTPATEKADGVKTYTCKNDPTHIKTEAVKYVAPDKDLDEVPKTGDNTGMILATMTGIAMLTAVAYVFGKKRSVR